MNAALAKTFSVRFEALHRASGLASMGRVRKVSGEEVMTEDEFAALWAEHHAEGGVFIDALRPFLARRLGVKNFRRLALVCDDQMLMRESRWMDAELSVVVRPYVTGSDFDRRELGEAACDGDTGKVARLLDRPLDPNSEADDSDEEVSSAWNPLSIAAENGHTLVVRYLLAAGAETNKADCEGWTPLHSAALRGHLEVVRLLLDGGADKDKPDDEGTTPLHAAVAGAAQRANNHGQTPLTLARHKEVMDLLESAADPGR